MAQHQITTPQELLDDSGRIIEEGYSTLPLQRYRRTAIRASWLRIKEWDYYAVIDQTSGFGVTMPLADLGYVGPVSGKSHCTSPLTLSAW